MNAALRAARTLFAPANSAYSRRGVLARSLVTGAAAVAIAGLASPAAEAAPVTTPVGCSAGDLTTAVSGAATGAVLALAPHCAYQVANPGLTIAASLTIQGDGATLEPATASPSSSMLTVDPGLTVQIADLQMINGSGGNLGNGGAIFDQGTLTVSRCVFRNDSATGGGGAIAADAAVTVTRSLFTGNTSGDGGAIIDTGSLTVQRSTFTGNKARSAGLEAGGAIYSGADPSGGELAVSRSSFSGNTAESNGGAIAAVNTTSANVTDSTFRGNSAASGGALVAITVAGPGQTVTVQGSKFTGNRSTAALTAGLGGGAIASAGKGQTLDLTRDSFRDNRTTSDGGALLNIQDASNVQHSQFWGNSAVNGGAVAQLGSATIAETLDLSGSTLFYNLASGDGGGIYADGYGTTTISRSSVDENFAGTNGGGIFNDGSLSVTESYFIQNTPDNCAGSGTC